MAQSRRFCARVPAAAGRECSRVGNSPESLRRSYLGSRHNQIRSGADVRHAPIARALVIVRANDLSLRRLNRLGRVQTCPGGCGISLAHLLEQGFQADRIIVSGDTRRRAHISPRAGHPGTPGCRCPAASPQFHRGLRAESRQVLRGIEWATGNLTGARAHRCRDTLQCPQQLAIDTGDVLIHLESVASPT